MKIAQQALNLIAVVAFTSHYNATKQAHWQSAEEHLNKNPSAITIWRGLVSGILINAGEAQKRGMVSFDPDVRGAGPGLIDLGVLAGLMPAPLAGLGRPSLADGAPARDLSPAGLAKRLSRAPEPVSGPGRIALDEARKQANELAADLAEEQPGLAIGRCTEGDTND